MLVSATEVLAVLGSATLSCCVKDLERRNPVVERGALAKGEAGGLMQMGGPMSDELVLLSPSLDPPSSLELPRFRFFFFLLRLFKVEVACDPSPSSFSRFRLEFELRVLFNELSLELL